MTNNQALIQEMNSCSIIYLLCFIVIVMLFYKHRIAIIYFSKLAIGGVFGIIINIFKPLK